MEPTASQQRKAKEAHRLEGQERLPLFKVLTRTRKLTRRPQDQIVDLFCGAGGLAEGFRMAGFETVLGVDSWDAAGNTFALAHPTANVAIGDIESARRTDFLQLAGIEPSSLGILCGGPPCQGFSLAGRTLADDPRNHLYKDFLRAIRNLSMK